MGRWERVEGNPFHTGKLRISTATFAPDWSVSGEELLRGWERRGGAPQDGLIAVDVVALADLLRITGPVDVPVYGRIDAANFTQKLVGDYDSFPSNEARHDLNLALVPVFSDRLLSPGQGRRRSSPCATRPADATSRCGCATPTCRPRSPTSASPASCPTPTTTTSRSSTRTPTPARPTTGSAAPSRPTSGCARTAPRRCG